MPQTIITAGDAIGGVTSLTGGNDGTLALVVGPAGSKVTALSIDATGRPAFALGSGVKEILSTVKTDTFSSATLSTWLDITGLSVTTTTTPAMVSTDKVLVTVNLSVSSSTVADRIAFRITRNGTAIGVGDVASSRTRATAQFSGFDLASMKPVSFSFYDSPAATTAQIYQVQFNSVDSVGTFFINRSNNDEDAASRPRGISTITLQRMGV